jgi:predicted nucleic acid-binding protein
MPRQIVIDASVTLAWLFDEAGSARRIGPVLERSDLVAPWLWRLEVVNVLLVKERNKLLTQAQSVNVLELLEDLDVEVVGEPPARTLAGLADVARPHQLTSYDAVYLELAMSLALPLFTRDNNLRDAAKRVGVTLVSEK